MHTVFNGGKSVGSNVKFSKFYLIIEREEEDDADALIESFIKFQTAIVKQISSTKLGVRYFLILLVGRVQSWS